jgi:hypothetical protein
VDGAHLELRSTRELCRNDKLVAAHHLCAILLAYVEKEPASFGAALNWERYNQCRGSKRTRSEPSMTDVPASSHHRRKATQMLPVAQYVGSVESGRLPLTPAAERQADRLAGHEPLVPRVAVAHPPRAAASQVGDSVCS